MGSQICIQLLVGDTSPTDYSPLLKQLEACGASYQLHTQPQLLAQNLKNNCHCFILDPHDDIEYALYALNLLRQEPHLQHIPILVVSNFKHAEEIEKTYAHGAHYILPKPLDFKKLYQQLNHWFGKNFIPLQSARPTRAALKTELKEGYHIVVADDDTGIQRVVSEILRDLGCIVSNVENGYRCLSLLKDLEPDLLLLNLHMPGFNGFEVMEKLTEQNFQAPIIIMSGEHAPETQKKALKQGAKLYLEKPFQVEDLLRALEQGLAHKLKRPE